jgi:hypothetical protein
MRPPHMLVEDCVHQHQPVYAADLYSRLASSTWPNITPKDFENALNRARQENLVFLHLDCTLTTNETAF